MGVCLDTWTRHMIINNYGFSYVAMTTLSDTAQVKTPLETFWNAKLIR